jgi:hypothetical protein
LPAAVQDANPLEGQGAQSSLVSGALRTLLLIERPGPVGVRDGLGGPLHKRLAQARGAVLTPVHPALVATTLGDGGGAGELLDAGRAVIARALLAEGRQQSRGVHGAGARQDPEQWVVGQCGGQLRALQVEALDGLEPDSSLLDHDLDRLSLTATCQL